MFAFESGEMHFVFNKFEKCRGKNEIFMSMSEVLVYLKYLDALA